MNQTEKTPPDELVGAIHKNTQWTGQTTRELRDKVGEAAKQIETLSQALGASSSTIADDLTQLTEAINRSSASSEKLSRRMVLLTLVLAVAAVLSVIAAFISLVKH